MGNNQKSLKNSGGVSNEGSGGLAPIQEDPSQITAASPRTVIMDLFGASIGSINEQYEKKLKEKDEAMFNLTVQMRKAEQEVAMYKERRKHILEYHYLLNFFMETISIRS